MGRRSIPGRSRWHVLVVGINSQLARLLESWLQKAVPNGGFISIEFRERLPDIGLDRYAAILIEARAPEADRDRLALAPDLVWRSRAVLDLEACPPEWVWRQMRSGTLPAIAVGIPGEQRWVQDELTRLLLADPVLKHLEPVLANVCSDPQRDLVAAFFRCTNATSPQHVAVALARAPRSLSRDCSALGLSPPQVLLKVARIGRGLTLTVLRRLTIGAAARVAGYSHSSSFRKATRNTFGISASALLRDWNDASALEERLRQVLFRRG